MMMRRISAVILMGLATMTAAPVAAVDGPSDEPGNQIVVANHSVTPVRVFLEDADGQLYPLGGVESGETKMLEAPADAVGRGDFRVRVTPRGYMVNRRDPVSIRTQDLHVEEDDTVVIWLDREMARSKVEVRAG
jgi:hypothetical protein